MENVRNFDELVALMDRLRDPGGCPWDREQTYASLRGYLLEECYEVIDALDREDLAGLEEELGDLLFQVVFLCRLAKEESRFDAGTVVRGIGAKMIRRHPHVFGSERAEESADVLRRWEEIKRTEKDGDPRGAPRPASILDGLPRALPALLKAERLGQKAARVGFDWPDAVAVMAKVQEEWSELLAAADSNDPERVSDELGDVLFSMAMLARKLGLDAERCLDRANDKFARRFRSIEAALRSEGLEVTEAGADRMNRLWDAVKRREPRASSEP